MRKHRALPSLSISLFSAMLAGAALPALSQTDFVISDFEDQTTLNNVGYSSGWSFSSDFDSHGNSVILSGDTTSNPSGIDTNSFATGHNSKYCLKLQYKYGSIRPHGDAPDTSSYDPEVGLETSLSSDTSSSVDFTGATKISFWAKADKSTKFRFIVGTPEITDFAYYGTDTVVSTTWKQFAITLKASKTFAQPEWASAAVPFNASAVKVLAFSISQAFNPGSGSTFYLDDITVTGYKNPDPVSLRSISKSGSRVGAGRLDSDRSFHVQLPELFRKSGGQVQVFGTNGMTLGQGGFVKGSQEVRIPLSRDAGGKVFYRLVPSK